MVEIRQVYDERRLQAMVREGFVNELVMVVELGDLEVECAFKVREEKNHVAPTIPPRASTLGEVVLVASSILLRSQRPRLMAIDEWAELHAVVPSGQ